MCFRFTRIQLKLVLLAIFLTGDAHGQEQPDAASLLKAASHNYSQAKQYHIEVRLSEESKSDLSGNWSNSFQTAIVGPDGRYRFEARGAGNSWLQVSNGTNEWIYNATTQEYVQKHPSTDRKPSHFGKDEWSYEEMGLVDAQDIPAHVAEEIGSVRNPEFAGSEVISVGNSDFDCFVVRGPRKYQSGRPPDTTGEVKFWVEKSSNYIRKIEEHWEGELVVDDRSHYTRANVEIYPVVDLMDSGVPPTLFEFQAPPGAKLVANFKNRHNFQTKQRSHLVGTIAPELNLRSADGRVVTLSSMRGKPALIEFWATWCGPCVDAFPKLEQLYSRAASQGIVVITVDEDEQPEKADAFLAAHRQSSWSNYHDDGEINRSLPGDGLPQFVLIDASGKIVYATSGFDEHELRGAIGRLGAK
jgi:thiol-disulfide isomerase/thioredoxin